MYFSDLSHITVFYEISQYHSIRQSDFNGNDTLGATFVKKGKHLCEYQVLKKKFYLLAYFLKKSRNY